MTTKIRLYTFTDDDDNVIEEVRAENHDQAVIAATSNRVEYSTPFYSCEANTLDD